jgi:hypothetical protein
MKHRFQFIFSTLLLLLASCTGTTAPSAPLFVIAGIQDANGLNPAILVLQDRALDATNTAPDAPRFVQITSQTLAATARAFDSVDEANIREELVVLSRSQDATSRQVSAYLDFFNTRGLVAADPATFRATRTRVDLRTLSYPFPLSVDTVCPIDLEVTRDGTHAVIFSSPSVCFPGSSSANDALIVIALPPRLPETTPASVVSIILSSNAPANPLVRTAVFASSATRDGVTRGGMFLDQNGDVLYYLRQKGSQGVELRRLEFSSYTSATPESDTNVQVISSNIPIRTDEFRDMTKAGSNLALLGAGSYVLAPLSVTTGFTPKAINTVDVRGQEPRAFVIDPTGIQFFILDDNTRLVYHADPTLEANTTTEVTGTTATFNTTSSFLYIAGNQGMSTFDLLPLVNEGNTNLESLLTEDVCDPTQADGLCSLNNPTALSWAQGILLPETQ